MQDNSAGGVGPCTKQTVTATIVTIDGRRFTGTNFVRNPQPICPRADLPTGVGYDLCRDVCDQSAHAEVNAIAAAGLNARGGTLYLEGHSYACEPCKAAAAGAGIARIVIGAPPVKGVIISLCDLTGNFVQPWVDAGYRAALVDPQHGTSSDDGRVERIAGTVLDAAGRLGEIMREEQVVFVAGWPPCTDVAVSGSRWFETKAAKDKHFQAKAALVAEQCRMVALLTGAPGFFENPVSVFSAIFGKASHYFNPADFTGYCENDNYTKKTCLWPFNGFRMPLAYRNLMLGEPDNRIHMAPPGPERANFRSATPMGFAQAVFKANAPCRFDLANDNVPGSAQDVVA